MNLSSKSAGRGLSDWSVWQLEQQRIGTDMLTEGVARILLSRTEQVPDPKCATLRITPQDFTTLWEPKIPCATVENGVASVFKNKITELFGQWNFKATISRDSSFVNVAGTNYWKQFIKLEPAEPSSNADTKPDAGA